MTLLINVSRAKLELVELDIRNNWTNLSYLSLATQKPDVNILFQGGE